MLIRVYGIATFIFDVIIQNLFFEETSIIITCENNTYLHTYSKYNVFPCELNIENPHILRYNMI